MHWGKRRLIKRLVRGLQRAEQRTKPVCRSLPLLFIALITPAGNRIPVTCRASRSDKGGRENDTSGEHIPSWREKSGAAGGIAPSLRRLKQRMGKSSVLPNFPLSLAVRMEEAEITSASLSAFRATRGCSFPSVARSVCPHAACLPVPSLCVASPDLWLFFCVSVGGHSEALRRARIPAANLPALPTLLLPPARAFHRPGLRRPRQLRRESPSPGRRD